MDSKLEKRIYRIDGMSCAACAAGIKKKLLELPAIQDAKVNYANGKGYVVCAENDCSDEQIITLISDLGYRAEKEEESEAVKLTFRIRGMTCAGCAAGIEAKLKNTEGIEEARINYASEKGIIVYRKDQIRISEIKKIISVLGYEASVSEDFTDGEEDDTVRNSFLRMVSAAILAGIVMSLMILKMLGISIPFYHLLTVILGFPVVFIIGWRVHRSSWSSLRNGTANMDVLVSLGSLPPYLIGFTGFFWDVQTFVEMATAIMTFHLIGKFLETKAKGKTSEAIKKLIKLGAKTARIEREGEQIEVAVEELETGDLMIIKPGEKIPIDGVIIEGESSIDESMVTGESMPVFRTTGEEIIGATINKQGFLKVKVTKTGKNTFLSQVIKLVEECQGSKVPIQDFADRVTGYFVPVIIVLTFLTFLSFNIFPGFHRQIIVWGASFLPWVNPSLSNLALAFISATAVLVIACPCALGLGTPTALMVGSGLGAENGILIRNGEAVQTLREIRAVAFDKTGTITIGKPTLTDIIVYDGITEKELLEFTVSLENNSEHPLARAITERGEKEGITLRSTKGTEAISGKGIKGFISGVQVLAGNRRMMDEFEIIYEKAEADMQKLEDEAKTLLLIAIEGKLKGLLAVADSIKEDSFQAIKMLNEMGITTVMLTGDNKQTARAIAEKAGIERTAAEVLPQGKVDEIVRLQEEFGLVAMVGDGINDAPALKQANVGIALGTGTDIAIEAADVTLIRDELMNVVLAIKLSRAIFRKIKENFFWAWIYNLVAVPVAMMGLLHPMIGAAAMSFSSLNVVYNSLRLKRVRLQEF